MVKLGILGKPFGLKGEIYFYPFNAQTESLKPNLEFSLKDPKGLIKSIKLEKIRWSNEAAILKFFDIHNKEEAALLTHSELSLDRSLLPSLKEGEFYLNDILGFEVYLDESSSLIGRVSSFSFNQANQSIMHIQGEKKQQWDILVTPFVKKVDLSLRRCYIVLPDYEE